MLIHLLFSVKTNAEEDIDLDGLQNVPVDVVMIGSISGTIELGSYYLFELIDIDESRLNIQKVKKNAKKQ